MPQDKESRKGAYQLASCLGEQNIANALEHWEQNGIILLQCVFCGIVEVAGEQSIISSRPESVKLPKFLLIGRYR